jgi:hypothetical protein
MGQLKTIAFIDSPDIICISESWTHASVTDTELSIEGYSLYRQDRTDRRGGGTLLYVSDNLEHTPFSFSMNTFPGEVCFTSIRFGPSKYALVGSVYLPPLIDPDCTSLREFFTEITNLKYSIKIIAGDFNKPEINWDFNSSPIRCEQLIDYLNLNGWLQIIRQPTRASNVLDLIFTNGLRPHSMEMSEGFFNSDHRIITCLLPITLQNTRSSPTLIPDFNKIDPIKINNLVEAVDWSSFFLSNNVEQCTAFLSNVLTNIISTLGCVCINKCGPSTLPTHLDNHLKRLRRKLLNPNNSRISILIRMSEVFDLAAEQQSRENIRIENLVLESSNTSSAISSLFKFRIGSSSNKTLPPVFDDQKNLISSDQEKANIFNISFAKNYLIEKFPLPDPGLASNTFISIVNFSPGVLERYIRLLRNSNSRGTDNFPNCLIKSIRNFPIILSKFFKLLLDKEIFPKIWKTSIVSPIFKSGLRSDVNNYRGVHITPSISKIFERILADSIRNFCKNSMVFDSNQHAFLPGRSCETSHLSFFDYLTSQRDLHRSLVIIYFDLSKAFDRVPHERLMLKLNNIGIRPPLLNLIGDYLKDRTQRVRVGSELSNEIRISSGVLQGTSLGPLLFLIYISELPKIAINSKSFIYADDLKCVYSFTKSSSPQCLNEIDEDLSLLNSWSLDWQMDFSPSKCRVMYLGNATLPNPIIFKGTPIQVCENIKDLGLNYDNNMNFDKHASIISGKALRLAGIIQRNFAILPLKVRLYQMYVLPILEFCSSMFCLMSMAQRKKVERVQKQFTRALLQSSAPNKSYQERCEILRMKPLWIRRLISGLCFIHRINSNRDMFFFEPLLDSNSNINTRNSQNTIRPLGCRTSKRSLFFSHRFKFFWNRLPINLRKIKSNSSFRLNILKYIDLNNVKHIIKDSYSISPHLIDVDFGPMGI